MSTSEKAKGKPEKSVSAPSFWSAVMEVIQGLKKQPALLYGFGMAIVILAAGTLALENLRMVAGTLLILALMAMVGWIITQVIAMRSRQPRTSAVRKVEAGFVEIDSNVDASENTIDGGDVDLHGNNMNMDIKGGNVRIGKGAHLNKNKIHAGKVK